MEFRNYSVRYRPGLELVLKNLTLRVQGGEKVLVPGDLATSLVGRTWMLELAIHWGADRNLEMPPTTFLMPHR